MTRWYSIIVLGEWQDLFQDSNDLFWAFNGVAGLPDEALLTAKLGEIVRIKIINDTSFPHAMHLHGFHCRKIEEDGTQGPLRDTLLVERNGIAEIAFVAGNVGDWLLHCHMLEHTAAGMLTWLKVALYAENCASCHGSDLKGEADWQTPNPDGILTSTDMRYIAALEVEHFLAANK